MVKPQIEDLQLFKIYKAATYNKEKPKQSALRNHADFNNEGTHLA